MRNYFRPVTPLIDQSYCIHTFVFDIYNTFGKNNPLSNTTSFPEPKIVLHILNIKLTVSPNLLYYFWPSCWGESLPSTIWDLHKIDFKIQQRLCLLLPKGWGLFPTHMNLGAYLLNHSIIMLLSTLIHYGLNYSSMLRFHDYSIWFMCDSVLDSYEEQEFWID